MESYLGQKMKSAAADEMRASTQSIGVVGSMAGLQVGKQSKQPAVAIQLEMMETNIGILRQAIEELANRVHPVTSPSEGRARATVVEKEMMGSPLANYVYRLNHMVQDATSDIRTITESLEI